MSVILATGRWRLGGTWFEARLRISINKLGVVEHICNPSYAGGIGRRINIRGWPG
jgi:hypothetical protein